MKSSTVNISFNDELLKQIDRTAQEESRSRSELVREAARSYIERKDRWSRILAFTAQVAVERDIREKDIPEEIAAYRRERQKK